MALCPNCNKEISENAHFCPECGTTLNTYSPTTDNTPVSVNSIHQTNNPLNYPLNKKLIALAIILILISVAVEFTTGFNQAIKNNNSTSSFSQGTSLKDKTSNPNIIDGLTLKSYTVENDKFSSYVTGVVSAQTEYFDKGAFVKVKFYDSNGNIIDEISNSSSALSKGDSWKFRVWVPSDAYSYEITTIGMLI